MLTPVQKTLEFLSLYQVMQENYPFFQVKKRQSGVDWLANQQQYIQQIANTSDDQEYYFKLKSILAQLQDSHLAIVSPHYITGLKDMYENIGYQAWSRKLAAALPDYQYWMKLIPKSAANDSAAETSGFIVKEYNQHGAVYLQIPRFKLSSKAGEDLKKYLLDHGSASKVIIDIRGNQGGNAAQILYLIQPLISAPLTAEFTFVLKGGCLINDYIPSVHIPSKDILQPLATLPDGLDYPPELFTEFKSYFNVAYQIEPCPNSFKGQVYLLVDQEVYSSAETLAAWCKSTGFATIVGERTKGDGIGFDPVFYQLPHSRLMLSLPLALGLNSDGQANAEWGTNPDIICNPQAALELILQDRQ